MPPAVANARSNLKSDRVYKALRTRILELDLRPGEPVRKDEIALEFGFSVTPVSDALNRLAEEGLVDVFPQHGSFVAQLRADDVREGIFIRTALEVEVARRVAELQNPELNERLLANLHDQEEALQKHDMNRLYELDEAMHDMLFSAIDYDRATKILVSSRAQLDRVRRAGLPREGFPEATVREHGWIVGAIVARDPELAATAMRAHLRLAAERVEQQLSAISEVK